jgi:alkanesulfonate monooxygenase SsuD/methylene tetrahydromethanopterin reductase-like flavin-dependent oxidoreductase (luciferase family)
VHLGLHLSKFSWPAGSEPIGVRIGRIAETADAVGFDRITVIDDFIGKLYPGSTSDECFEAYTTLGFLAGKTSSVKLLALCTAVVYRRPGLLAKAVTTLDVISGGRAMLGVGSALNRDEAVALGAPHPPPPEPNDKLEEAVQVCLQMWSDSEERFDGKYFHLGRTVNSPPSITRPHPPILIEANGEPRRLRLVARHADGCIFFSGDDLVHDLDALRAQCDREQRAYDEIEKAVLFPFRPGQRGSSVGQIIDDLGRFSELGITVAIGAVDGVESITPIEIIGERVIPEVASL